MADKQTKGPQLKVYEFYLKCIKTEVYDDFTVVARSKDGAWRQIQREMRNGDWTMDKKGGKTWINNIKDYYIDEIPLNKPSVTSHFCLGKR